MAVSVVRPVLGIPIRFNCESDRLARMVSKIYPPGPGGEGEPEMRILLKHAGARARDLSVPAQFVVDDECLEGRSGDTRFRANRVQGCAEALLCGRMLGNDYLLRHQVFNTLCFYLLTYRHYYPVHGACFRFDRWNVLCLGKSGVGKSTLAFAAMQRGLPVVSEDICFVGADPRLGIRADCRELHLCPDSYARLEPGKENPLRVTHNGKRKHIVGNARPWGGGRDDRSSGVLVLFLSPRHSRGETKLLPLSNPGPLFHELASPGEEGFNLYSHAGIPALRWLRQSRCIKAEMGHRPEAFFETLGEELGGCLCVTP